MATDSYIGGHRLEYVLTGEDYVAFNLHTAKTLEESRRQLSRYRILGALGLALFVAVLDVTTRGDGLTLTFVFAAITAVLWWALLPPLVRRSMRRSLTRFANTTGLGPVGPTSLRLDARGVHEECGGVATSARWSQIRRVDETAEHGFIFISPMAAFVVPKTIGTPVSDLLAMVRLRLTSEQAD